MVVQDCAQVALPFRELVVCQCRSMPSGHRNPKKEAMKIQLNTDVHIDGIEGLAAQVSATVEQALERLLDSTLGRLHDHRETTSGLPLSGTDPE